jgi:predicted transcriptional regulator
MDVLFQKGRATAAEVLESLDDIPSSSAVRGLLRVLENKGHVRHEKDGARYVFIPTVRMNDAKRSAVRHLVKTFFGGSPAQAVAALLDLSSPNLSGEEADRLMQRIQDSRKGGTR